MDKYEAGQILKCYHFTGARRKKHYIYKVLANYKGKLLAVNIEQLARLGMEHAHKCEIKDCSDFGSVEIIHEVYKC